MRRSFYDRNGNIIDYYKIFNIPFDADESQIKASFYRLVKLYHPDLSKNITDLSLDKLNIVMNGYRTLLDPETRSSYTNELFKKNHRGKDGQKIIPNSRIKYSISLAEMVRKKSKNQEIKTKEILSSFDEDIEIFITMDEQKNGARAYIELPARMQCPLCNGDNPDCYICLGLGRIHTSSSIEVSIPAGVGSNTLIEADLRKIKPDRLSSFRAKKIRIRISVQSN